MFPVTAGGAGLATAAIAEVLAQGVTKISLVYDDSSGVAKPAAEAAAAGLAAQGIVVANIIPMAIDIADASSILAAAEANDAQGVALLVQGAQAAKFISAADQAGSKLVIGSYDLSLEPATIKTLGPAADGVIMASSFKQLTTKGDAGVDEFLAELKAYNPSMTTDDWSIPGVGIGVYAATHLVAQAAEKAATLDAAGVLAALPTITDFDIGIMAPIDFSSRTLRSSRGSPVSSTRSTSSTRSKTRSSCRSSASPSTSHQPASAHARAWSSSASRCWDSGPAASTPWRRKASSWSTGDRASSTLHKARWGW